MSERFHLRPNDFLGEPAAKQQFNLALFSEVAPKYDFVTQALKSWGGFWGWVLHGNPDVYGYIADSLRRFPDREALHGEFMDRKFKLLKRRRYFGGLLEFLIFEKEEV